MNDDVSVIHQGPCATARMNYGFSVTYSSTIHYMNDGVSVFCQGSYVTASVNYGVSRDRRPPIALYYSQIERVPKLKSLICFDSAHAHSSNSACFRPWASTSTQHKYVPLWSLGKL
jgi:hypothetical protein